jgi:hypothetical protein
MRTPFIITGHSVFCDPNDYCDTRKLGFYIQRVAVELVSGLTTHHCGCRRPRMNSCSLVGVSGGSPVRRTRSAADHWLRIRAARFSISNALLCFDMLTICDLLIRYSPAKHSAIQAIKLADWLVVMIALGSNSRAATNRGVLRPKPEICIDARGARRDR